MNTCVCVIPHSLVNILDLVFYHFFGELDLKNLWVTGRPKKKKKKKKTKKQRKLTVEFP